MILTSAVYFLDEIICTDIKDISVQKIITFLLTEPIHLWYIYAIISLYCITPIIKVFCVNAKQDELRYAIWFCFIIGTLVFLVKNTEYCALLDDIITKSKIPYPLTFIGYYILGYYISKYDLSKLSEWLILVGGFICMILSIIIAYFGFEKLFALSMSFFAPNVLIQSIAIFISFKKIYNNNLLYTYISRFEKLIFALSKFTFAIYLWHPLILKKLGILCNFDNSIVSIFSLSLITYFICIFIMFMWKNIKNSFVNIANLILRE